MSAIPKLKDMPIWQEELGGEWVVYPELDSTMTSVFNFLGMDGLHKPFTLQGLFELRGKHNRELFKIEKRASDESWPAEQIDKECEPHNQQLETIEQILRLHPDYPFDGKCDLDVELGQPE